MNKLQTILVYCIIIAIFYSCDYADTKLVFKNRTTENVVITIYSDANFNNNRCVNCEIVETNSERNLHAPNTNWADKINHMKDSTLTLFVYKLSDYQKTDWNILKKDSKIIYKTFKLKVGDLDAVNWNIILE